MAARAITRAGIPNRGLPPPAIATAATANAPQQNMGSGPSSPGNPSPSLYEQQTQQVQTPAGSVEVRRVPVQKGAAVVMQPKITKNVTFSVPIEQSDADFKISGEQTYTYQLQKSMLVPTQTGASGTISYKGTPVADITKEGIVAKNAEVTQVVRGKVGGDVQTLGTISYKPVVSEGGLSLEYSSFKPSMVQITNVTQVAGRPLGITYQAMTEYDTKTGMIKVGPALNYPTGTYNMYLNPKSYTSVGFLPIAYNVAVTITPTGVSTKAQNLGFLIDNKVVSNYSEKVAGGTMAFTYSNNTIKSAFAPTSIATQPISSSIYGELSAYNPKVAYKPDIKTISTIPITTSSIYGELQAGSKPYTNISFKPNTAPYSAIMGAYGANEAAVAANAKYIPIASLGEIAMGAAPYQSIKATATLGELQSAGVYNIIKQEGKGLSLTEAVAYNKINQILMPPTQYQQEVARSLLPKSLQSAATTTYSNFAYPIFYNVLSMAAVPYASGVAWASEHPKATIAEKAIAITQATSTFYVSTFFFPATLMYGIASKYPYPSQYLKPSTWVNLGQQAVAMTATFGVAEMGLGIVGNIKAEALTAIKPGKYGIATNLNEGKFLTTLGKAGEEIKVYTGKIGTQEIRVVGGVTEKPASAGTLAAQYVGKPSSNIHATFSAEIAKFGKTKGAMLEIMQSPTSSVTETRAALDLRNFYVSPQEVISGKPTGYGGYVGIGKGESGGKIVFGGTPTMLLLKNQEVANFGKLTNEPTRTYIARINARINEVGIPQENYLGMSSERQLIMPAKIGEGTGTTLKSEGRIGKLFVKEVSSKNAFINLLTAKTIPVNVYGARIVGKPTTAKLPAEAIVGKITTEQAGKYSVSTKSISRESISSLIGSSLSFTSKSGTSSGMFSFKSSGIKSSVPSSLSSVKSSIPSSKSSVSSMSSSISSYIPSMNSSRISSQLSSWSSIISTPSSPGSSVPSSPPSKGISSTSSSPTPSSPIISSLTSSIPQTSLPKSKKNLIPRKPPKFGYVADIAHMQLGITAPKSSLGYFKSTGLSRPIIKIGKGRKR